MGGYGSEGFCPLSESVFLGKEEIAGARCGKKKKNSLQWGENRQVKKQISGRRRTPAHPKKKCLQGNKKKKKKNLHIQKGFEKHKRKRPNE